jgi:hypothetical protein
MLRCSVREAANSRESAGKEARFELNPEGSQPLAPGRGAAAHPGFPKQNEQPDPSGVTEVQFTKRSVLIPRHEPHFAPAHCDPFGVGDLYSRFVTPGAGCARTRG